MNKPTNTHRAGKAAGSIALASAALLAGMQVWEKQALTVYADKLANGLPTYCSGRTLPTRPVGQRIDKAECDAIDHGTALEYGRAILACIPADRLDQNSFDALTLFAINVGKAGACNSRAARLMRDGQRDDACRALASGPDGRPAWSYASGKYVQGLQNRRQFESAWCLRRAVPEQPEPVVVSVPAPLLAEPLPEAAPIPPAAPLPWWRRPARSFFEKGL